VRVTGPSSISQRSAQLFYSEGSPYARICRMALREGGLIASVREVTTTLRDPAAAVLPFSPVGRVPTLVLPDGTTLTETTLILGWLDRHGSEPTLLPTDDAGLALCGRVLGLLDGIAVWNRELRRPESERSPSVIALEVTRADRVADALEGAVAKGAFSTVDAGYLSNQTRNVPLLAQIEMSPSGHDWRTCSGLHSIAQGGLDREPPGVVRGGLLGLGWNALAL